jgi:hypothetical protein
MEYKITPEVFMTQIKDFLKEKDICLDEITFDDIDYEHDNALPLFHMAPVAYFEYGATRGAFIPCVGSDFVFKFDFDKLEENYCRREADIYLDASMKNLDKYFASINFYATLNNTPVYIQEYVDETCWDRSVEVSKEEIDKVVTLCNKTSYSKTADISPCWILDFIKLYGEDELLRLFLFLEEEGVNDLHDRNVGYIHNKPVLFDYSGFYESRF